MPYRQETAANFESRGIELLMALTNPYSKTDLPVPDSREGLDCTDGAECGHAMEITAVGRETLLPPPHSWEGNRMQHASFVLPCCRCPKILPLPRGEVGHDDGDMSTNPQANNAPPIYHSSDIKRADALFWDAGHLSSPCGLRTCFTLCEFRSPR